MRALNMTELDHVSGGEGDDNDNDDAGTIGPGHNDPNPAPVYPPFIPTQPWVGSDGNTNLPP